ncbi:MAG: AMP-binding protein, partial [Anaerolineae bacterium]
MTIRELLESKAKKNGNKTFLLFKDERVSYAEMDARANSIANGLLDIGIGKGDKVSVIIANCPEFLYVWFGLCKVGAEMVPINFNNRGEGLRYIIDHSDSKAVFAQDRFLPNLHAVLPDLPKIEKIIVVRRGGQENAPPGSLEFDHFLAYSTTLKADIPVLDGDVMAINYTSGTTGAPKGALIPQAMYPIVGTAFASWIDANPDYVIYTCLPLYHANAQGLSTAGALAADCTLALGESFSASTFWDDMRRYNVTEFNYVGGIIPILFKQPPREDDGDNPVKYCWGAAAPRDIWRAFEERFGVTIIEGYGTTEDSIPLTNPLGAVKLGSVGK